MDRLTVLEIKTGLKHHMEGIWIRIYCGHLGWPTVKINKKQVRELIKHLDDDDWIEGRFCGERGGLDMYLLGA